MRPNKIKLTGKTIYVEIEGHKIKLSQKESVRLKINMKKQPFIYSRRSERKLHLTSWRKKVWEVQEGEGTRFWRVIRFQKRNAAIMWLKRYSINLVPYRLNGELVCVANNHVYFYDLDSGLKNSAESKRTNPYAIRNN